MSTALFKSIHTRDTLRLAWPLVITQVGHIITGMVDNIFLGHIGAAEQAAGILSNNLYMMVLVFVMGMSYAVTPLTTEAFEKNDVFKKAALLKNSLFLNLTVAVGCFVLLYNISGLMHQMRQPAEVVTLAIPFFDVLIFSMIPLALFFTCKQYCEGLSNTRMALYVSVVGNLLNVLLNYLLIYGHWGCPELGYIGSAWASFYARLFMGFVFLWLVFRSPVTREVTKVFGTVKVNLKSLAALWKIGFNSALQFTFEVAAFAIAGFMAGSFGKEQIDAHGIALSIAAFTYMFASGISSAATIRVGIYKAQRDLKGIKDAAFTAIKLVLLIMGGFGLIFLLLNSLLPLGFSREKEIVELASSLLIIAAMFQLFDGLQVTVLGILRGLEDVKIPTVIVLIGYWVLAIPLSYFFAFNLQMETKGIWIALLLSLVFVAVLLFARMFYVFKRL